eukprot:c23709_g1_i1 orf=405-2204(-)
MMLPSPFCSINLNGSFSNLVLARNDPSRFSEANAAAFAAGSDWQVIRTRATFLERATKGSHSANLRNSGFSGIPVYRTQITRNGDALNADFEAFTTTGTCFVRNLTEAYRSRSRSPETPVGKRRYDGRLTVTSRFKLVLASQVARSLLPISVLCHVSIQSAIIPAQGVILSLPTELGKSIKVTGGTTLSGHVHISGSKNSALAVLAASLCSTEELYLRMVPNILDTQRMVQVLRSLGVQIRESSSCLLVDGSNLTSVEPCSQTVKKLRASFFVIGPLVARYGEAVVDLPGGCTIGARPVDLHMRGLKALGADVEVRQGKVYAHAVNGKRLTGGRFHLDFPSVGATETLMMAACLADGKSVLSNVAQEPEVVDLARFLVSCGARIQGAGTSTLIIDGMKKLHGTDFTIIPDRIEAGTFLIAAAITRSSISLSPVMPSHLAAIIDKLRAIGCSIHQLGADALWIGSSVPLRSSDVSTRPYPGFPTDLQPQLISLLATCCGQSIVEETVFENRMAHVEELRKLGAQVTFLRNKAIINGSNMGSFLCGAPVKAGDLRAGAALILAGMAAEGVTCIKGVNHIDRGYERIDEKLCCLGANIERLL